MELELREPASVSKVELLTNTPGGKVQILKGGAGGEVIAEGTFSNTTTFELTEPVVSDSFTIWVTELPQVSDGFRLELNEVVARADLSSASRSSPERRWERTHDVDGSFPRRSGRLSTWTRCSIEECRCRVARFTLAMAPQVTWPGTLGLGRVLWRVPMELEENTLTEQTTAPAAGTTDAPVLDVVIVGSGPAGYTAAIYAARAGFAPVVIAGSVTAGGALMNTTEVENFPGFPAGIQGPDMMEAMREQAEKFGAQVIWDDAEQVELTGDVKTIVTGGGDTYRARAVILATGSAYRELGLSDEKRLSGRGVSWCATCDGFFFRDQDIAVVGGGDSAMEEATFLTRFASKVTVVHRRDDLRASKIMAERAIADPKIEFAWNSEVAGIYGDSKVSGISLRDTVTGEIRDLDATGLFVAIGHEPRTDLVKGQVDLDEDGYILVEGRSTPDEPSRRLRLR